MHRRGSVRLAVALGGLIILAASLESCVPARGRKVYSAGPGNRVWIRVVVAEGAAAMKKPQRRYRGRLLRTRQDGTVRLVNQVALEDYVRGVLPGEISPGWPPESVKAMAVVARTYAYEQWMKSGSSGRELYSDVRSQEYCGKSCEDARSNRMVDLTAGLIIMWNGEPLPGFSHACCGGRTEDVREVWGGAAVRPLSGRDCPWCEGSKHYGPWTVVIEKTDLAKRLAPVIGKGAAVQDVQPEGRTGGGRVKDVRIEAGHRSFRIPAVRFRSLVGYDVLRSTYFSVSDLRDSIEFRGTGWGHGVGLCQEGAKRMAERGMGYEEILAYYFPGCEIWRLL